MRAQGLGGGNGKASFEPELPAARIWVHNPPTASDQFTITRVAAIVSYLLPLSEAPYV